MRIEVINETIQLKNVDFMFKLEPSGNVVLAIDFLQVVPHLCSNVELSKIEYNSGIN